MKNRLDQIPRALDSWIHGFYRPTAGSLALYRMLYAAWALFIIPVNTRWIEGFPASFFHPPLSIVRWMDAFPAVTFFQVLDVVSIVLACALFLGYKTRATSLLLFASILIGKSFIYAFGKSDHGVTDFVPLVMAFSGWGAKYSLDAVRAARRGVHEEPAPSAAPLAMMALLLGFGMFTAGMEKLVFGWLQFGDQVSYAHALHYEARGNGYWGPGLLRDFEIPWLFELADWTVVVLEIGFLFSILRIGSLRFFCSVAPFFHFNNVFFLRIPSMHFIVLYPLFFDMTPLERRIEGGLTRFYERIGRYGLGSLAAFAGLAVLGDQLLESPLDFLSRSGLRGDLIIGLIGWGVGITLVSMRMIRWLEPWLAIPRVDVWAPVARLGRALVPSRTATQRRERSSARA